MSFNSKLINVINDIETLKESVEDISSTINTTLQATIEDIEDGDLTIANTDGLQSALNGKQPTIEDGDLTIANTDGLQSALNGKQPTIEDGYLIVANTDGLQSALNGKQPTIEDGDLTIANTDGLQSALNGKQPTIEDGDLTIAKTYGLQTAFDNKYDDTGGSISGNVDITGDLVSGTTNIISELETKQDEITISTDLTCNILSSNQVLVSDPLFFDTIVIRRPTDITGFGFDFIINLQELQCWVNDENILASNAGLLQSYFALSADKENDIGEDTDNSPASGIYNNLFSFVAAGITFFYSVHSPTSGYKNNNDVALIIKDIPPTAIQDIQSLVLYNRTDDPYDTRTIGLSIELYNEDQDASLSNILISTSAITTANDVYRYDFNSIDTYTSGFVGGPPQSTTNIPNDTYALKEIASTGSINDGNITCNTLNTKGNVDISGNLSVDTINCTTLNTTGDVNIGGDLVVGTTNIITEIGTKQDQLTAGDNITIDVNNGISSTGGGGGGGGVSPSTDLSVNSITTTEDVVVGG